jgi:hypothetical protein
MKTCEQ